MSKIKRKQNRMKRVSFLKTLTVCAMMVALSVVFCRLLGFPQSGATRIELGFLPIAIVAVLYGPIWSMISYGLADFIGALIFTGVNPFITLCKIFFGLAMGFVFYKKEKIGLLRNILFFVIAGLLIDGLMMTPIFVHFFGYPWEAALAYRMIGLAVNTPARIIVMTLTDKFLLPPLKRQVHGKKSGFAAYANGFQAVPRLGLERITYLMGLLGNPQEKLRCIHVAGTNGKGSVCAFTESILRAAGYRVGKYISPNLVRVNERISIDGADISDADLNALLAKIEKIVPEAEKALGDKISQFEIWTAAAFCYFAEKAPDYVVLETGLGGEFDATNVICKNVMAVITQIDIDHTEYLGNTIEAIATTKSKIIKSSCESGVTVMSAQGSEAIATVQKEADAKGTRLVVPKEAVLEGTSEIYEIISYGDMKNLKLGLGGTYQVENACTAIECALALNIGEDAIREGLLHAKHSARFEIIDRDPTVIYDGGHNPNGVRSLKASIDRYYPETERTIVFACMADKEFMPSLAMLNDGKSRFVFTTVQNNPRAMGAEALCVKAKEGGIDGEWRPNLKEAIAHARTLTPLVIVCGSLYLYGDLY